MKVIFEGAPPFELPTVQNAAVQFSGETVLMTLFLLADGHQLAPVRVPMSIATAQTLGLALSRAALEAESQNGRP